MLLLLMALAIALLGLALRLPAGAGRALTFGCGMLVALAGLILALRRFLPGHRPRPWYAPR